MKNLLFLSLLLLFQIPVFGQIENLDIEGAITIGESVIANPPAGTIRWTGTDFEGFNGTCWISLTGMEMCPPPTDGCGNTYTSIVIGTQEWLLEDLKTTKCNDGTLIPVITDNTIWQNLTTPGVTWYNNDETTQIANGYGALYNWHAVNSCNVCPVGWHVPTDAEYTTLIDFLDPAVVDPNVILQSTVSGEKLKEAGTAHWNSPNVADNSSGWTGLPGGFRNTMVSGLFGDLGVISYYWSSTEDAPDKAWARNMINQSPNINRFNYFKGLGFSVRCIKD